MSFTSMYKSGNPCKKCDDYCISCVKNGEHLTKEPYEKPIREGKKEHYNTYIRWLNRNESAVMKYVREHYEPADHVAEIEWLLDHPKVAYQLINSDEMSNNVKVAQIIASVVNPDRNYTANMVIGMPGSGKTWTTLWLAENAHLANPDRNYAYFSYTDELHVPEWMDVVTKLDNIPNDSFVVLDEAGLMANARRAMRESNVKLGQLLNIRRHKGLQIFFVSQEPEDVDKGIRRQMDMFFIHSYSFTSTDSRLMERLYSFTPETTDPHMLGFYDSGNDFGLKTWQPAPRSEERNKFSEAYEDVDITKQQDLIGKSDEKEEKVSKSKLESEIKKEKVKTLLEETDLTQAEIGAKVDLSRSRVANINSERKVSNSE